ncbi:hypothetical protein QFZ94_007493 [Paraburkholderia sp. JPY465]|uniref:hypothetical protein n=1 Tax=Paraburkholderia sp. JPY465 TaxID=3042285 RepID=UPI003D1D0451
MPRSRTVKGGFFRSPDIQHTPVACRLLFISLWTQADREGRLEDLPWKIRDEAFPYDQDITEQDVDEMLDMLNLRDLIRRYVVDEQPLIFITKWRTHQHPHPKETESKLPAPPESPAKARQSRAQLMGAGEFVPGNDPVLTQMRTDRARTSNTSVSSKPSNTSGTSIPSGTSGTSGISGPGRLRLRRLSSSSEKTTNVDAKVIAEIFAYWQKTMNSPRSKLDAKRTKAISIALTNGYTAREVCTAIRGCSLTPHNMGDNDRGEKFNDLTLILRDAAHVDRFIANDANPPQHGSRTLSAEDRRRELSEANGKAWLAMHGQAAESDATGDPNAIDMEP